MTNHAAEIAAAEDAYMAARVALFDAVDAARDDGTTWAEIGAALRVTKQAAQQRFGEPDPHPAERAQRNRRRNAAQDHAADEPDPVTEREEADEPHRARTTSVDAYQTTVADQLTASSSFLNPKAR